MEVEDVNHPCWFRWIRKVGNWKHPMPLSMLDEPLAEVKTTAIQSLPTQLDGVSRCQPCDPVLLLLDLLSWIG